MTLSDLLKVKDSLLGSLEKVDSDIEKICIENNVKKKKVQYYSNNRFVEVDTKALAMAYILVDPDISVDELAQKLGVNRRTIYNWDEVARALKFKGITSKDHF